MSNKVIPQKGFQEDFLSTPADIAIGGGAAGVGKTWALLAESSRHVYNSGYGAEIFRRTYPEITQQGGMWDESKNIFPYMGANPNEGKLFWSFPSGSRVGFSHIQYEKTLRSYQGAQMAFIAFDEMPHFTSEMFFYMLSRNRSTCGVIPYIRATCNPDPDSWVARLIEWWIDQESGYPDPEKAGKVRYMLRDKEAYIWGNSKGEVIEKAGYILNDPMFKKKDKNDLIKSVTFIPGSIYQNKKLLSDNPQYLSNLLAQDEDTQLRLLRGNWKIRVNNASLFDYSALTDMFTNDIGHLRSHNPKKYIIIDHARFGKDFLIAGTWEDWHCRRIDVMPSSSSIDIVNLIGVIRSIYRGIPMSNILIDQDGIGVKDILGCRIFMPGAKCYEVNREVQYYRNRQTQVHYMAAEKVNDRQVLIDLDNVWFHDPKTKQARKVTKLYAAGRTQSIKELIIDDLRTLKRENFDNDQRKAMTKKEERKAILGRSPDFGDMIGMRADYEFVKSPQYMTKQ